MNGGRKCTPQAHGQQCSPKRQKAWPQAPGVLQPKAAAPRVNQTPAPPPVYSPQAVPKVLQRKVASGVKAGPAAPGLCATHGAPRAGSSATQARSPRQTAAVQPKAASPRPHAAHGPAGRIASAPSGAPPRPPGVIQRMEDRRSGDQRAHNVNVVVTYSNDIGKSVRDAFINAGYNLSNWAAAAKKALTNTQWHHSTIAHGLGGQGSGMRGGTDEDIKACAQHLISWARNHPYQQKAKDKSKYGSNNKKDDPGKRDDDNNNNNGSGNSTYKAPWNGGPPAWISQRTD